MANVRVAFDNRLFVIVPKPSAGSFSSGFPLSTSIAEPPAASLILTPEARDFANLYQNVSIQTKYINALSPEFLFAHFAWALFPYLRKFLLESKFADTLWLPKKKKKGESASASKKRRGGPSNQDGEPDDKDDAYEERWKRRSTSRERGLFDYDWENTPQIT
ncbi:hypothetical protein F5B21DRAFT_518673 [Xylaria acuta]|nr:hypothetical protein F5B21DRAFT_518673 [Xylaria acuta]